MKILVFAHRLELGGTQVNAIELAAALRDLHGHDVVLFATPGPMQALADAKRLRCIAAPDVRWHPSPARVVALRRAIRDERPDVMHVWDWWQCLDACVARSFGCRVPMLVTDMMMELTRVLPKRLPTTFGTPQLVDQARAQGRRRAHLLLPPVDAVLNAPDAVDSAPFVQCHGLRRDQITLVTVSRLADFMKSESLARSIAAVRRLGRELPLRFVIVGDGAARARLQGLADEANAELGREAVTLAGALVDPRPAYAAADIVIGMGGSALRGMAFGKPVLIVGEQGFVRPFNAGSAAQFHYQGFYGHGDGDAGNERFCAELRALAQAPRELAAMAILSRHFVEQHFSLEAVSAHLSMLCQDAARTPRERVAGWADAMRTASVYLRERRFLTPSADARPRQG